MNAQMLEVSIWSRNGAASSRKGGVVNGQTTKASNKGVPPHPCAVRHMFKSEIRYVPGTVLLQYVTPFFPKKTTPSGRLEKKVFGRRKRTHVSTAFAYFANPHRSVIHHPRFHTKREEHRRADGQRGLSSFQAKQTCDA